MGAHRRLIDSVAGRPLYRVVSDHFMATVYPLKLDYVSFMSLKNVFMLETHTHAHVCTLTRTCILGSADSYLGSVEEGIRCPGTGVIDGCESPKVLLGTECGSSAGAGSVLDH